jgi:[acyl-carrier-protein] S-malonyltransferase
MSHQHQFAFVFPGQGSQSVGMLDTWSFHPQVKLTLEEASQALGEDLGALIAQGPKETLALTANTQPVMLAADVAIYRTWLAEGGQAPVAVAGHSLGEYAALVASGVLSLTQAIPLVRFRAQAMQDAVAVGVGAMAAILGMDAKEVEKICHELTSESQSKGVQEVVEAVNFNDPMQTVIAGNKALVEMACVVLKEKGAKRALPLPVSAPFHSTLMKPAADKLKERLASIDFQAPGIPVINNVDVAVYAQSDKIKDALFRQAYMPVRWVECIQALKVMGIQLMVECGPGQVLSGLTKRIDASLESASLKDFAGIESLKDVLKGEFK